VKIVPIEKQESFACEAANLSIYNAHLSTSVTTCLGEK